MLEITQSVTEMTTEKLEFFFLVMIRVSFLIFLLPIFGSMDTPNRVKIGLTFFLALIFYPIIPHTSIPMWNSAATFFYLVIREAILGFALGFGSMFLIYFVNMGGYIIGRDMGFMQSQSPDIVTGDMSDNTSNFIAILFIVIFMITGGHYFFIQLIHESFVLVPVASYAYNAAGIANVMILLSSAVFLQGIKLASPIMASILLSQVGMAFVARVMPQMNIWIVGIPVKIGIGILILIATLPLMYRFFENRFFELQYSLVAIIKMGAQ
jgi:flagellar biosynthesis protein FliR